MNIGVIGRVSALFLLSLAAVACSSTPSGTGTSASPRGVAANPNEKIGTPYYVSGIRYIPREQPGYVETGLASWYGPKFHGRLTANGEIFDRGRLTAAHKTLPLPSLVRVTNTENNRSVVVRLNDRGPFSGDRIIDLSEKTAETIGLKQKGVGEVRVEYLGRARLADAITAVGQRENYAALKAPKGTPQEVPAIIYAHTEPTGESAESLNAKVLEASYEKPVSPVEEEPDEIDIVMSGEVIPSADNVPVSPPSSQTPGPVAYYVQVGVFSDPENAVAASNLFDPVIPVSLEPVAVGSAMRQRVKIGPYAYEFAAQAALREARAQGFADAHIVRGGVLY